MLTPLHGMFFLFRWPLNTEIEEKVFGHAKHVYVYERTSADGW